MSRIVLVSISAIGMLILWVDKADAQNRWPPGEFQGQLQGWSHEWHGLADPCTDQVPTITETAVGLLAFDGTTLGQIVDRCQSLHFGWFSGPGTSLKRYPAVVVQLGPAPVVAVFHDSLATSPLMWIVVRDPELRTPAGVGVGSTLAELKAAYGDQHRIHNTECSLEALFDAQPGLVWTLAVGHCDARRVSDSVRVAQITVIRN